MIDCLIALGSNLGEREQFLDRAVQLLSAHPAIANLRHSRWLATTPVGGPLGQGEFLNGAARLETTLSPDELLAVLQDIERDVGRERAQRWGPRVIDLDLLLYGEQIVEPEEGISRANEILLRVPHPRMAFRRFVLQPAAEIAAEMRHPQLGRTIGQLLERLNHHPPFVTISSSSPNRAAELACRLAESAGGRVISRPASDIFSTPAELSPEHFEQLARNYLQACDHQLPACESWSPDDWIIADFHPADVFRRSPKNLSLQTRDELLRRTPTAKLCILDRPGEESAPGERMISSAGLLQGPWLDVSGMEQSKALEEMTAAVHAMKA